jgi:hypothetical protein
MALRVIEIRFECGLYGIMWFEKDGGPAGNDIGKPIYRSIYQRPSGGNGNEMAFREMRVGKQAIPQGSA